MEHIEEAGVHSGDSACSLPPHSLDADTMRKLERQTVDIARALRVVGLMNIQFAVKGRRSLCAGSQPASKPHGAFRRQGHRSSRCRYRGTRDGGRKTLQFQTDAPRDCPCRGQGGGFPLRAFPRDRSRARPRDALHGRGHGHRPQLCRGIRQEPARERQPFADDGNLVRVRQGRRQGPHRSACQGTCGYGLQGSGDSRHSASP